MWCGASLEVWCGLKITLPISAGSGGGRGKAFRTRQQHTRFSTREIGGIL